MKREGGNEWDHILAAAGLSRAKLARAFRITPQRAGQIFNGRGVSYELADDLQRFINRSAGRMVCSNEQFIAQHRKENPRRR